MSLQERLLTSIKLIIVFVGPILAGEGVSFSEVYGFRPSPRDCSVARQHRNLDRRLVDQLNLSLFGGHSGAMED